MDAGKGVRNRSPCARGKGTYDRLQEERQKAAKLLESQSQSLKTGKFSSQQAQKSLKVSSKNALTPNASTSKNLLGKKSPTNKENNSYKLLNKCAVPSKTSPKKSLNLLALTEKSSLRNRTPLEVNQTKVNTTEYVPRKNLGYNDVSDLLALDSITLENSTIPTSTHGTPNVSFNPAEITGRSTLHQRDHAKILTRPLPTDFIIDEHDEYASQSDMKAVQQQRPKQINPFDDTQISLFSGGGALSKSQDSHDQQRLKRANQLTVDEILASSFAPKVHEIRKSLIGMPQNDRLSTTSSCISNFSEMLKNPRPTTNFNNSTEFSFFKEAQLIGNELRDESCTPGELFAAQLINDEIEWAKEKKAMPTANFLSKDAQKKLNSDEAALNTFNSTATWNAAGIGELSVGEFFQVQSAELSCMVQRKSPIKEHTPFALISDESVTTTTIDSPEKSHELIDEILKTPVIDDRTYDKPAPTVINQWENEANMHRSKDSGNGSGKTDPLNLSSIEEALVHLTSNTCNVRSSNASQNNAEINNESLNGLISAMANAAQAENAVDFFKQTEQLQRETEKFLENKENIEAFNKNLLCQADTISFTDSLLNTSIQNYRMSSVGQARSPLSPIPIVLTEPRSDNDADIDDPAWSPDLMLARRKRLTKSPKKQNQEKQQTMNGNNAEFLPIDSDNDEDNDTDNNNEKRNKTQNAVTSLTSDKTPVNHAMIAKTKHTMCARSLSSTRLETAVVEGSSSSSTSTNSPHFSKANKTLTPTQNHNHNNSSNKQTFELSPFSSPRSYLSSAINSPLGSVSNNNENRENFDHNCHCSPSFDNATNSEQRFLSPTASSVNITTNNGLRRIASSPSASEARGAGNNYKYTAGYGAPLMRTYSSNSVKSIESTSSRSVSRCSSNSEFTHRDGRILPLKVTLLELSWGSIKLHKSSQKSLQIRNISNKRLALRIQTYGPGFQLVNPETTLLTLTAQECRTIVINFCPTMTGPAVGRLSFQPPRTISNSSPKDKNTASNSNCCNTLNNELAIPLYAYGGHASISIQNIIVGPLNMPFFPIGDICALYEPLEGTFKIYNKGPLLGFVLIEIEAAGGLQVPGLCNAFQVEPQYALIAPNMIETIRLIFKPNREDIKKIRKIINEVLTLAKMRIVYGDEALRQRLRQVRHNMPDDVRERIFSKSLDKLWQQFPNERTLNGLDAYKDESSIAYDISTYLTEKEAAIILNNNAQDETATEFSTIFNDADQSVLFRTVIAATSPTQQQLETLHEHQEEACDMMLMASRQLNNGGGYGAVSSSTPDRLDDYDDIGPQLFSVTPESIYFDFWAREEDAESVTLAVHNNFGTRQYFNVSCSHPNLLYFTPTHGNAPTDGQINIEVRAFPAARKQQQRLPNDIVITVYMDSQKITVPVRVPSKF